MKKPLISIIIPSYNYAHFLARSLLSVIKQANDRIEVLLIDDGSTDETESVVQDIIQQFPELAIDYVFQENAGAATARNKGIELSRGEYILFLDADDALVDDCFANLIPDLEANRGMGLLVGSHISIEEHGKQRLRKPGVIGSDHGVNFKNFLFKKISISNGAAVINKAALEKIRFDHTMSDGEDIPFFALLLANYDCHRLNYPLAKIYKHQESLRSRYDHQVDQRDDIVSGIFDSPALPKQLKKYHQSYLIYRLKSAFKKQYRQRNGAQARFFLHQVMRLDLWAALKPSLIFKYIISFIR